MHGIVKFSFYLAFLQSQVLTKILRSLTIFPNSLGLHMQATSLLNATNCPDYLLICRIGFWNE